MKLLFTKLIVMLFCVPVYFLVLFADYYRKVTAGDSFSFKKSTWEYWQDVRQVLKYKKEG